MWEWAQCVSVTCTIHWRTPVPEEARTQKAHAVQLTLATLCPWLLTAYSLL